MNPRDLPEVVAELIVEMHEVRSELQGINGRIDRLESQMQATRDENRENTDRLLAGFQRMLEPFLHACSSMMTSLKIIKAASIISNLPSGK